MINAPHGCRCSVRSYRYLSEQSHRALRPRL